MKRLQNIRNRYQRGETLFYARSVFDVVRATGHPEYAAKILGAYVRGVENARALNNAGHHTLGLMLLCLAYAGHPENLAQLRLEEGTASYEKDFARYDSFLAIAEPELSKTRFEAERLATLDQLRLQFLDPAFRSLVEVTNPLILEFFAKEFSAFDEHSTSSSRYRELAKALNWSRQVMTITKHPHAHG